VPLSQTDQPPAHQERALAHFRLSKPRQDKLKRLSGPLLPTGAPRTGVMPFRQSKGSETSGRETEKTTDYALLRLSIPAIPSAS